VSAAITAVDTQLLAIPLEPRLQAYGSDVVNIVRVLVRDADGARGTGFTYTLGAGAGVVCRMIDDLIGPALVGEHTEDWDRTRSRIAAGTRRLGRSVFAPALSAVDIAVWDLRGLQADQPLYAVLGGTARALPIYGSGRGSNRLELDELVGQTIGYLDDGYPAVKVRAGARAPGEDLKRLTAVRAAVGDEVPLMVDCNEHLTLADALWLGKRLTDLGYRWLEEPLIAEDVQGHAVLASQLDIPIAVGEHLVGRHEFAHHLQATPIAVYQPDAALTGGVGESLRIAALAEASNRSVNFHSLPELHVHLAAACPNACYVEDFGVLNGILGERLVPHNGTVAPSQRPGHGIVWDTDAVRRFTRPH
jgi:L-alanine-DL-glutamate epimerase-like enolase superfamily enzyme